MTHFTSGYILLNTFWLREQITFGCCWDHDLSIAPWLSASHDNVAQIVFFCSSAVCIERVPPLVPELSDLQKRMMAMLQQVEFEQSKKCEHELRHEEDL